ncbi:nucleotidyl transferase AbiEii/AbiGii toxin family protein [Longispora urticae]
MVDFTGEFEIHLTVSARRVVDVQVFAARHGLGFAHIILNRGYGVSQPMLTVSGTGTEEVAHLTARRWQVDAEAAGLRVSRVKIEVAPWNEGVPDTDEAATGRPPREYFEHHVKLLLPDAGVERLLALAELTAPHGAQPSRNARRRRSDSREERFVTQRCRQVGQATASARLEALLADLRASGHEVVETEQEYVIHDSNEQLDHGWLEPVENPRWDNSWWTERDAAARTAPAGSANYPATYQPAQGEGVRQRAVFDPAVKQYERAFRPGEPDFADPRRGVEWRSARRAAMDHVLGLVAAAPWADSLMLRGSALMAAWFGDAAREPADLDFVVLPADLAADSAAGRKLLAAVIDAVRASPGCGLDAARVAGADIWTYERAEGRRLVFPFVTPGLPEGTVQLDFVFAEPLPLPPEPIVLPGLDRPLLAATPALSLAWKLQWLATDLWPQGKDLYDAVLLAEHTTVPLAVVRELLRPEWGGVADTFRPETVLTLDPGDWDNFRHEGTWARGPGGDWLRRLAVALDRSAD